MMDGTAMYPGGFHPSNINYDPSNERWAKYKSRRAAQGVKYYVTDFGLSTRFADGESGREMRMKVGSFPGSLGSGLGRVVRRRAHNHHTVASQQDLLEVATPFVLLPDPPTLLHLLACP